MDIRGCFLSWQLFQRNLQCSSWEECCLRHRSSFLPSFFFFFSCVCFSFWTLSFRPNKGFQGFRHSRRLSSPFLKNIEVKQTSNLCTPSWVTDGNFICDLYVRKVRKYKRRSQTRCSSLNTDSTEIEIQLLIEICGFSSIFMSELVVPRCWIRRGAALTRVRLMMKYLRYYLVWRCPIFPPLHNHISPAVSFIFLLTKRSLADIKRYSLTITTIKAT